MRKASEKYLEKLRDPRWQKKRLEILSRDSWMCQICCNATKTLHVHHKYYLAGREPWEHPDSSLITLCADCHQDETERRPEFESDLIFFTRKFLDMEHLQALVSAFEQMPEDSRVSLNLIDLLAGLLVNDAPLHPILYWLDLEYYDHTQQDWRVPELHDVGEQHRAAQRRQIELRKSAGASDRSA